MTEVWTELAPERLDAIASAVEGERILVLGDVMLDRYLWGNVTRISPEAPVPVVEVDRESMRLGGAANVAHNVLSLKGKPELIAVVGEDVVADRLRHALSRVSVPIEGLLVDPNRRTSLKTRIVARGQHVVRADQEDRREIDGTVAEAVTSRVLSSLDGLKAVIISDYGKGVVTRKLLESLLPAARERGIPVCVDPKDTHFNAYTGVAVVTPNQYEAAEVLGYKLRDEESVGRAGREILNRLDVSCVLITRGEDGMSLFEREPERRTDFPVVAKRIYDVTGAGDTVVSGYATALAGGAEPREAALLATHSAGLVVSEVGTAVPDFDALRASFGGAG